MVDFTNWESWDAVQRQAKLDELSDSIASCIKFAGEIEAARAVKKGGIIPNPEPPE